MPESASDIGIIILAAGYSERFEGDKRQSPLANGKTLLDTTLAQIPANFSRRLLVLHPGDELLAQRYAADWRVCIAEEAKRGMGYSLAAAISQVKDWPALVIGLGDMPFVQPETYSAVQQALRQHKLVRPYCQGRAGNPVGIAAEYYAQLIALEGDQGARGILRRNADQVYRLECPDWGITQDIDTKEALKA